METLGTPFSVVLRGTKRNATLLGRVPMREIPFHTTVQKSWNDLTPQRLYQQTVFSSMPGSPVAAFCHPLYHPKTSNSPKKEADRNLAIYLESL